MKVAEKFLSINGEGPRAGELSCFIRFQGCNLACSYCDTAWANEASCPVEEMEPMQIVSYVHKMGAQNVTLTGGEPLLQPEIYGLLDAFGLARRNYRIEIETNGSISIEPFCNYSRPAFTLDIKTPSSGFAGALCTDNFGLLKPQDAVKIVCGDREDLEYGRDMVLRYKLIEKCPVYFSAVFGKLDPRDIVDFMIERNMNGVRLQLQMHKFIWNPDTRGV